MLRDISSVWQNLCRFSSFLLAEELFLEVPYGKKLKG
jgi:hypothetical protein